MTKFSMGFRIKECEMSAFNGLSQLDTKILITNDDIDYSTSNVRHIKLKDFLLMDNLEK